MGSPNWSKIPFEKMPKWKQEEILAHSKKTTEELEGMIKKERKRKKNKQ